MALSGGPTGSGRGTLLVAVPLLGDPNFHRTVVYLLQHTDDGALGLVLNRPTEENLILGLEAWTEEMSPPRVVFDGGPVQADTLIALASLASSPGHELDDADVFAPLGGGLGTVDLAQVPGEIAGDLRALRVFRGYSGWAPGQLEDELAEGAWILLPSETDDVFTPHPQGLWRNVLRRSGGREALLADAPEDLSWN